MAQKIVFTASVMDCFHEGHKNLLEEMSREGKIIVILHDDYSTFLNKNRFPVQSYKHRKKNILKTGLVDKVYKCSDPDPTKVFLKIIKKHQNLLYMRGNDWLNFPGRETLEANKVPIKFIPYTEGISTSLIRAFIKL